VPRLPFVGPGHRPYVCAVTQRKAKTPFLSRLLQACDLVGARLEVIPNAENAGRITLPSGRVRYFQRLRWDLNTLGAAAIALDKDATAHQLKRFGYTVPTGRSFTYDGRLREARDIGGAYAYARRLGLPVLLKPNDSYADQHVFVVYTRAQFYTAARAVFAASKKLLVQRIARGSDCSIVVLDDEVLMATEKTRPYVLGDGRSTIRTLIGANRRHSRGDGPATQLRADDERVSRHLAHDHRTLETVPSSGQRVELLPCGNLGVGGDVRVVTDVLHPRLRALAIRAVADMGLRLASVDLVLSQPSDAPPKRCTVLEVNSAPGLDTHEREPGWSRRRVDRVRRILLALDRDLDATELAT
jgi:D-alanine-D-alanine ligase-like ATP-grasp enzyme